MISIKLGFEKVPPAVFSHRSLIILILTTFSCSNFQYLIANQNISSSARQLAANIPTLYFYFSTSKFRFTIYNYPNQLTALSPFNIYLPPADSNNVISANYSIPNTNYVSFTLSNNVNSITVQFDRSCLLPILVTSLGYIPSVKFVTTVPQAFNIASDQCGIPLISSYGVNNMGQVPIFGSNTFNPVQTDFFQQKLKIPDNPNSYILYVSMYCPYFQAAGNNFLFSISVQQTGVSSPTLTLYDSSGNLINSTLVLVIPPGETVKFLVHSTQTSLSFPADSSITIWAMGILNVTNSIISNISIPLLSDLPARNLQTGSFAINSSTSLAVTSLVFPTGANAYVYAYNSDPINTHAIIVTLFSNSDPEFFSNTNIIILVVSFVILVTLAISIPLIVVKCRNKEKPRIVYEQRTFIINNQVIQQDIHLLEAQQLLHSGFKVEEISPAFWDKIATENNKRIISSKIDIPRVKSPEKVLHLYAIELSQTPNIRPEKNVLASYMERTF